jgi:hypothetical protein
MKTNPLEQIAKLLPEGLTESMVESIATLVHQKIQEEVNVKTDALTVKVKAFLRGQIDSLKEQAIKELELENDTFRNAQLFESVRAIFATELTSDDEVTAVNLLASEQELVENKLQVLAGELDKSLNENIKLKKLLKVVSDKNTRLEESLTEQKQNLAESRATRAMRLSDTAEVVSKETFQRQGKKLEERKEVARHDGGNQFLTEDVLRLIK